MFLLLAKLILNTVLYLKSLITALISPLTVIRPQVINREAVHAAVLGADYLIISGYQ